jgi:hypothetical protein
VRSDAWTLLQQTYLCACDGVTMLWPSGILHMFAVSRKHTYLLPWYAAAVCIHSFTVHASPARKAMHSQASARELLVSSSMNQVNIPKVHMLPPGLTAGKKLAKANGSCPPAKG